MAAKRTGLGVLAVAVALTVGGGVAPASAEFFGCNTPRTTVSYFSRAYGPPSRVQQARAATHEFAAQRSRQAAYSHRTYRRQPDRWR